MKRITFSCEFKSDVILNAQTATEGNRETLEYVAGSNFLGILANLLYPSSLPYSEQTYELFHSGKVRFKDAHITLRDIDSPERSLKIPLAWHLDKGRKLTDNDNYVIYEISSENFSRQIQQGIQLKQVRAGYFLPSCGKLIKIQKDFQLKSKYDRCKRTSEEGKMFGYSSLRKGTQWLFSIDFDDPVLSSLLTKIVGNRFLGRSKSAQYGWIAIDVQKEEEIFPVIREAGRTVLYAESDLCFIDQYGQPTFRPSVLQLGLPASSVILWEASQIRYKTYAPWNGKRKTREADRMCIEKGSVFVVDVPESFSDENILKGVGCYRNEGLGSLLINPFFLRAEKETGKLLYVLSDEVTDNTLAVNDLSDKEEDNKLLGWLGNVEDKNASDQKLLNVALCFVTKYRELYEDISNSQWGTIRKLAMNSGSKEKLIELLFEVDRNGKGMGYLEHGITYKIWHEKQREYVLWWAMKNNFADFVFREEISDNDIPACVEKIAALMQK